MFLTSVIIVLREVLEAVVVLSLFLAISYLLHLRLRWLGIGVGVGLVGAVVFGFSMDTVSDSFDGVGQELANAALQISMFPLLIAIVFLFVKQMRDPERSRNLIAVLMASSAILAITREGSEILVYFSGFAHAEGFFVSVLSGALIGAAIGISIGILAYYALVLMKPGHAVIGVVVMLCLVGAGMSGQGTQQLIQADWLTSSAAVWDSSGLIQESSVSGQLLYAVIGYEATPSLVELMVYCSCLAIVALAAFIASRNGAGSRTVQR